MRRLVYLAAWFSVEGPAWCPRGVRRVPLAVLASLVAWRLRLMRGTH